jgi:hypothetical protein
MSDQNEYSELSNDELSRKLNKFRKLQLGIFIAALVASIAVAVVSFSKNATQGYQIIPLFLIVGIAYPFMAFGGIRKKIKTELDSRSKH